MKELYLSVLKNLNNDGVFAAFTRADESAEKFNDFLYLLYSKGCEENFTGYVDELIVTDDNAFSRCCAHKKQPSEYLKKAFLQDIVSIYSLLDNCNTQGRFSIGSHREPLCSDPIKSYDNLLNLYAVYGYGAYLRNSSFIWENSRIVPVRCSADVSLCNLKDYKEEKKIIAENISAFLDVLPFCHMLLYGERGTGKSSTVRAMAAEYFKKGLRLVELNAENLTELSKVREAVSDNPLKFIIFIDDLTLSQDDEKFSSLKSGLEGSIAGGSSNAMVVATSNRRHVVNENFSERQNAVHAKETIDEQLSLSDRFGLTVMFSSVNKEQYLSIVLQLADDSGINYDKDALCALAERWALLKGGRSPRRAKQFVGLFMAAQAKGVYPDF